MDAEYESEAGPSWLHGLSFPSLAPSDLAQVASTIQALFSASSPAQTQALQASLQQIQSSLEAWGLISGLAGHPDPNVRFFSAHTAQVKVSRDWSSLPDELRGPLLQLLLDQLRESIDVGGTRGLAHQPGNGVVVRKLFGALASLLLRLPFHLFPHPLLTVLQTIASTLPASIPLPASLPSSGYSTPAYTPTAHPHAYPFPSGHHPPDGSHGQLASRTRMHALEWLSISIEEITRAGLSEQKRGALRAHLEKDIPGVMEVLRGSLDRELLSQGAEGLKELDMGCKCTESWVGYGLSGDDLSTLLPSLYALLPLPSACACLVEILSESIFRFGKGTKLLTEPIVEWCIGSNGQALFQSREEPTEEQTAVAKLVCGLVEHSADWLASRIAQAEVQAFLSLLIRLTDWPGLGGAEENISELTLAVYPLLQEAVFDSDVFTAPRETDPNWALARQLFSSLVDVIQRKARWPGEGESGGSIGGLDKEEREGFETWRRDAGEVIICAYYVISEDMLRSLMDKLDGLVNQDACWQDVEAVLHCIRYSSEAVPLGEEKNLPALFGDRILSRLATRPSAGKGEARLRLTMVSTIQAYEEWFKTHPDYLPSVLSYLVPSLTSTASVSRAAADALKALCDLCRNKLVQHIGAFSELHGKIGDLRAEEQTKVIQAITSVIQALSPVEAMAPVEGILTPVINRLDAAIASPPSDRQGQLVQAMEALTACFKGLSPSDEDIFDLGSEDEEALKADAVLLAREDPRMLALRQRIEASVQGIVVVWTGEAEVADSISSLIKHSTLASSPTLISLSPLSLLSLVSAACERSPSALWFSLASTLTQRENSPPSPLTKKKDKTPAEQAQFDAEESYRWTVVADTAGRLAPLAVGLLGSAEQIRDNPDVVEGWFKFCSALAARFPGVLLRLPEQTVQTYLELGLLGLGAQERHSLRTACEFLIALLHGTRYPSPLEGPSDPLWAHVGPGVLRAVVQGAGADAPRSVIPNLAELLAALVQRCGAQRAGEWLEGVLWVEGWPDARATGAAKTRLKETILRSRTTKKMREALHEFALVARGLDGTTYGNATAI